MAEDLVSCLMVTGHDPCREPFGRVAIESFRQQTWPNKELLILNQSFHQPHSYRLLEDGWEKGEGYSIAEYHVLPIQPLGTARNQLLEHARGEWLLPWDDDDWSHPERITRQMHARNGQRAVVPSCYLVYSFPRNTACVQTHKWCCGLMLFPRGPQRYEPKPSSEDWALMELFPDRIRWENPPEMYIRTHHGMNTWHEKHILGRLAGRENTWLLLPRQQAYLKDVLAHHYPWATIGRFFPLP